MKKLLAIRRESQEASLFAFSDDEAAAIEKEVASQEVQDTYEDEEEAAPEYHPMVKSTLWEDFTNETADSEYWNLI